ncbi:Mucin-associated surface protein (MASP) [Trypanosoma cruzi]|uniref:Mucin-associated surface protein (MASP), putative n=2 Tax=Trypanosoma cruzi TaxID=5693 RepID=Q4CS76_TRYCC|nr:mucin-associated surface protein (MASP), putative [Trypanosoma cruzi]EAN83128.1 mucin-associated surface protein (MASP), putative [Trypanosoma cruzi]PWV06203.1 Mucin-associated surface protein (MASP) [Trypanosoma cruzi]|eukprot:XP_804979.1 mucin-associated surface protein (MASP) [Trypanosoma cruzi strain CL Brener]
MAMMMTGRVLLLCGLCVLWCGVCGGLADEETAGSGSGDELPPESQGVETSPQDPQGSQNRAPGGKENITPERIEEADDDDDDDDDDGETKAEEERSTERQSVQEGAAAPDPVSREENLSDSGQEKNQAILSAEDVSLSGSRESNANPTQTEFEEKKDSEKNPPAVEDALTTGNGGNTLPGGVARGNFPSSPEDGVDSRKQDGEETTSENKKNVPSPTTAVTPQSHREEGSEGTGEDTKATTVTANKTDTTNTQNSDSSTAVSHTTSPLLLLLVVACAAAAAVVAA